MTKTNAKSPLTNPTPGTSAEQSAPPTPTDMERLLEENARMKEQIATLSTLLAAQSTDAVQAQSSDSKPTTATEDETQSTPQQVPGEYPYPDLSAYSPLTALPRLPSRPLVPMDQLNNVQVGTALGPMLNDNAVIPSTTAVPVTALVPTAPIISTTSVPTSTIMPMTTVMSTTTTMPSTTVLSTNTVLPPTTIMPTTVPISTTHFMPTTATNAPPAVGQLPGQFLLSPYVPPFSPTQTAITLAGITPRLPIKMIDLPEFDGSAEKWTLFKVNYDWTTQVYGYDAVHNYTRLDKALRGKARQAVEGLMCNPLNVPQIMNQLESWFGSPTAIVQCHLAKIQQFPAIAEDRLFDIVDYSLVVSNTVGFIASTAAAYRLADQTLLDMFVAKLPSTKQVEWTKYFMVQLKGVATVHAFAYWLEQEVVYLRMVQVAQLARTPDLETKEVNAAQPLPPTPRVNGPRKCLQCNNPTHRVANCPKFGELDIERRWTLVKDARCCFCCLNPGHITFNCKNRRPCGIAGCKLSHNRLLHMNEPAPPLPALPAPRSADTIDNNFIDRDQASLYKFVPVQIRGPKGVVSALAFIDDGSKASFVERDLADALGLSGPATRITLKWYNGVTVTEKSRIVDVEIGGIVARRLLVVPNIDIKEQSFDAAKFKKRFNVADEIPLASYSDQRPRILLGVPHTHLIRPLQVMPIGDNFTMQETRLGWTVSGGVSDENDLPICHVEQVTPTNRISQELAECVTKFFDLDQIVTPRPTDHIESQEDKRAMSILQQTTHRTTDGHYETGLLWKEDNPLLPCSYSNALQRLYVAEKKMCADSSLREWYLNKMNEYVEKGYAVEVARDRIENPLGPVWYLPHFVVANKNKGNKRRMIFDAAARCANIALNDALLKGPPAYQPVSLVNILLHFREAPIAVCADVKEMFHRVKIIDRDRDALRFLWRTDPSEAPRVFAMEAMIFGSRSSPCSAQFVKNLNADEFIGASLRAITAIKEFHYVDDYVDCFDTVEEAVHVCQEVVKIHRHANFELRGFTSNSTVVLGKLKGRGVDVDLSQDEPKILGLYWASAEDSFRFKLDDERLNQFVSTPPTKSQALSIVMSLFDPLGFLANVSIRAKLFMQSLWSAEIGWTNRITAEMFIEWQEFVASLRSATTVVFPRCHSRFFRNSRAQLHVFTDASAVAYAAVAYWRIESSEGVAVRFVMGKSRCAPRVAPTIPRLELQAAVLGVKLKAMIIDATDMIPVSIHYWTDSKTVLKWITAESLDRKVEMFITNRLYTIQQESSRQEWRWVPGKDNPADAATRMSCDKGEWLEGPLFLQMEESQWPKLEQGANANLPPSSVYNVDLPATETLFDLSRHSTFVKARRVAAFVLRAVEKFKCGKMRLRSEKRRLKETFALSSKDIVKIVDPLMAKEVVAGEMLLLIETQRTYYSEERNSLLSTGTVSDKSVIYDLSPILRDGVLRLGGRLCRMDWLPYDTRYPIILPKDAPLTTLIVQHYHLRFYHQNFAATIIGLRGRYWIRSANRKLRHVVAKCQLCKNRKATPTQPLMSQLPVERASPFVRPFTYTGVDYAGPFSVAIGRRSEKRWIALFTCLTVRAVHLEVAKDLSTPAFLQCFQNMAGRRGLPLQMRSDRGTNFIGAAEVLANAHVPIEWKFTTPRDPAAGGCWERLIGLVKRVLRVALEEEQPQLETFVATVIEAEAMVNSRPLTSVPLRHSDDDPLTPNHFLLGCSGLEPAPTSMWTDQVSLRGQWELRKRLSSVIWKRFSRDYVPTLVRREKWHDQGRRIGVDDIVVFGETGQARGLWTKGRVTAVHESPDGYVRSATVAIPDGDKLRHLTRPTSCLAKLDV